jgi:DNA-binding NarL/FixJ family response regulator
MAAKILIVDDHDVVRQGVRSIISKARPEWEICGEAADGEQAVRAVADLKPDVVVLDVTMPVMNGLEASSRIVRSGGPCRVLILTMHESERLAADVQLVGAHGYVQKSQAGRDLIRAIDVLLAGGTFFGSELDQKRDKRDETKKTNPDISSRSDLSSAQSDVTKLLGLRIADLPHNP